MFTWDWMCKHTVFFTLRALQGTGSTGNRQHREQAAQGTGSAPRALCTICSHGTQLHHQSILHNLFTVACSAQPQGVLSPVG